MSQINEQAFWAGHISCTVGIFLPVGIMLGWVTVWLHTFDLFVWPQRGPKARLATLCDRGLCGQHSDAKGPLRRSAKGAAQDFDFCCPARPCPCVFVSVSFGGTLPYSPPWL